jgi:hypothetical protein
MWRLEQQPSSQDSAGVTSVEMVDSCSDSRVNGPNWDHKREKRKTIVEIVFRFIIGSPEGIRTLDLMAENHASWTTRRRGLVDVVIMPKSLLNVNPSGTRILH